MIIAQKYHRPAAFTLIEVLVVMVIMSIIAGAAVVSFNKPIRAARIRDAREQVRYLDDSARQYVRRFGRPVQLVFDLTRGTLTRREGDNSTDNGARRVTYRSTLPPGYRIETIRTTDRRSSGGEVTIACSPLGLTPSYALHLTGPGLNEWLLVAGLAGEITTLTDDRTLDAIFQADSAR